MRTAAMLLTASCWLGAIASASEVIEVFRLAATLGNPASTTAISSSRSQENVSRANGLKLCTQRQSLALF